MKDSTVSLWGVCELLCACGVFVFVLFWYWDSRQVDVLFSFLWGRKGIVSIVD